MKYRSWQILHGNVIPLWERECSIQRRNQKVVEEAPSPFISEETRIKMLDAAVKAAKHIGYSNAGTIEFLVDKEQNFYFLEMNTRLQVEHPVTEEITGLDLVEKQLKVASGERTHSYTRKCKAKGACHRSADLCRGPENIFSITGKITEFQLPQGEGVRNECAIEAGTQVTPFYDPMIGKLIAWGETRIEACARIKQH